MCTGIVCGLVWNEISIRVPGLYANQSGLNRVDLTAKKGPPAPQSGSHRF